MLSLNSAGISTPRCTSIVSMSCIECSARASATVPWNRIKGSGQHLVSVYSATIPLEKGKTVVSVTLPVNIDMHVFAIGTGE